MKDDGDFLNQLRTEIESTQARRASYVRAKLTFVVSMIGVGSVSIIKTETTVLLYLAPFVAYIFDLYVFGEDFGIRRAGAFMRESVFAPESEKLWEATVSKVRDPFTKIAGIGSTFLVLVIAATLLYKEAVNIGYCYWLLLNAAFVGTIWAYGWYIDTRVNKFISALKTMTQNQNACEKKTD